MYFILFSRYKSIGYVWRGIKTIFRPQKLYRAGTARSPRALKFLDLPLTLHAMPKFCSPSPAVIIKSQHERSILERDIKQLTTNKQSFNNSKENWTSCASSTYTDSDLPPLGVNPRSEINTEMSVIDLERTAHYDNRRESWIILA